MSYDIVSESGISDFYFCKEMNNPVYHPHVHSHMEFIFVQQGCLHITISENRYVLHSGQMAMVTPYEPHGYEGQAYLFVIACPPEYLPEYRQILTGKTFVPPHTQYDSTHTAIIADIVRDDFQDDFKKKALLYYAVSKLLQNCTLEEVPAFEFDVYRKAVSYISKNYRGDITLAETAAHVGVTQSHLSRVLNKGNKPGFTGILNSLRAYAARRLLEQENRNISEVAMAVGFGSIRNFNRIFKEHFGYNPTEIKK